MIFSDVLTIGAGITGVMGLLGFIAALYFYFAAKQATSVIENIAGEYRVSSKAIIEILKQFQDDYHRLKALEILLQVPAQQANDVLDRIKQVQPLAKDNYRDRARILSYASAVFAFIAVGGLVAVWLGKAPKRPTTDSSATKPVVQEAVYGDGSDLEELVFLWHKEHENRVEHWAELAKRLRGEVAHRVISTCDAIEKLPNKGEAYKDEDYKKIIEGLSDYDDGCSLYLTGVVYDYWAEQIEGSTEVGVPLPEKSQNKYNSAVEFYTESISKLHVYTRLGSRAMFNRAAVELDLGEHAGGDARTVYLNKAIADCDEGLKYVHMAIAYGTKAGALSMLGNNFEKMDSVLREGFGSGVVDETNPNYLYRYCLGLDSKGKMETPSEFLPAEKKFVDWKSHVDKLKDEAKNVR